MSEKRNAKRLDLDVTIELERIDQVQGNTTVEHIKVDTVDMSKSGIGFISDKELELESFYNTKLQIWTKETINTIIKIVRRVDEGDGTYRYGAFFIGMTEKTELKIGIYEILHEYNEEKNDNENKE